MASAEINSELGVGAAVIINCHFQNDEAEATVITLALNYYRHMGPVHHDEVVYSDSMSSLQAFEGEDTDNHFICHTTDLVVEWQGHTCLFLLDTKPLWHWGKWKSGPTSNTDTWPRHRPTCKCPLYRFEAIGQLLHSANQVGCSCTWQRSLSLNQSWRDCNHPTSNYPYQGHLVPYVVTGAAKCLSPLCSNTDHWPYAPGVCSVTGMLWRILHSWLIEYSLRDNSRDLHSGIPTRSGIIPSNMNGQTFYTIPHLNHSWSDAVC